MPEITNTDLLRHVLEAGEIMATRDSSLTERLLAAAPCVSVALMEPDQWPSKLLKQAQEWDAKVRRLGGHEQTIRQLSQRELQQCATELYELFVNTDRAIAVDLYSSAVAFDS